jgi:hypothetical protein
MLIDKTMEYNGWTKREAIVAAFLEQAKKGTPLCVDNETTLKEIDEKEERYKQNEKRQKQGIQQVG